MSIFRFALVIGMAIMLAAGTALPSSAALWYNPDTNQFEDRAASGNRGGSPIRKQVVDYQTNYKPGTIVIETGERRLYLVLEDGKAMKYGIGVGRDGFRWSGTHRITLSPRGAMFIDSWSSRTSPTRVALRSTSDPAAPLRTLDTNPVHTLDDYILHPTERFQVPTRDGFLMEAAWTLPTDFDPSRERHYPVWIMTYAGPGAPTISDTWGAGLGTGPWDQALATAGVIVLRIDPRSASGKGARYAWTAYKRLGVQELQDLEDAITWLKTHNWVDPDRIGLSGHSYGGYMTAFALTHSTSFAAGIAGAPVTDWRDYDSIYTERYMSTPQDNPDGYDASSALKAAKNLHGRLLIAHGALDDNVHPTNTLKFIRALQDANKQFDLAIYPTNRHGIGGRQYQRLMHDFILRTMTRPTSPSSP